MITLHKIYRSLKSSNDSEPRQKLETALIENKINVDIFIIYEYCDDIQTKLVIYLYSARIAFTSQSQLLANCLRNNLVNKLLKSCSEPASCHIKLTSMYIPNNMLVYGSSINCSHIDN